MVPSNQTFFKRGEDHLNAVLTDDKVMFIRRSGLGLNELAERFGVCKSTIHRARTSRSWKHLPRSGNPNGAESGYRRITADTYITPAWCWQRLHEAESWAAQAWDCCPAAAQFDFLKMTKIFGTEDIASNPPYGKQAEKIIRHALKLTEPHGGKVAMLLPVQYDCAKGRVDLFENPPFKRKLTLLERIRWANLEHTASPSSNHSWYVWDRSYVGTPTMGWVS